MPCPSRRNTRNTYFRHQDHQRQQLQCRQQRQQNQQNQELYEALAHMLHTTHIAPPPDHYLMRQLQQTERREEFAREQVERWRTMLFEHLEEENNRTVYWAFWKIVLILLLILGFILILVTEFRGFVCVAPDEL